MLSRSTHSGKEIIKNSHGDDDQFCNTDSCGYEAPLVIDESLLDLTFNLPVAYFNQDQIDYVGLC